MDIEHIVAIKSHDDIVEFWMLMSRLKQLWFLLVWVNMCQFISELQKHFEKA